MSLSSRRELLAVTAKRYASAGRAERSALLSEFVNNTGYDRNYAVSLFNYAVSLLRHPQAKAASQSKPALPKRPRSKTYGTQTQKALEQIWRIAGGICGKRLVPLLPEMIEALERFGEITLEPNIREKLLTISPATCDRLLKVIRAEHGHGLCTTRPTPHLLLRSQIPIRTFADWDEDRPGFLEIDLVAHCGETVKGDYAHTLTLVDVFSGWTLCAPLPNKSRIAVTDALDKLRSKLPVPLLGLDTDNGSEFMNYHLIEYCEKNQLTLTRCRPYKKNDQCHVEQKNGNVVRNMTGYGRYEGTAPLAILTQLYRRLADYQNFFQPSMKLTDKHREGATVTKRYDTAKTPAQRLINAEAVSPEVKEALKQKSKTLNPAALHRELTTFRQELRRLAVDYVPAMDQLASLCDVTHEDVTQKEGEIQDDPILSKT
jgi:hypothetical protein